jgi:hypothetical protein
MASPAEGNTENFRFVSIIVVSCAILNAAAAAAFCQSSGYGH